ncbi:hypothetical protein HZA73_01190 [candidate division TA06 bacterium]|nr:hypothetical protein [candidate division TA06 bacterium]
MLRKYCFVFLAAGMAMALFSCTKRKPEEIEYAPNAPNSPYPPDRATNIDHTTTDVTLSWKCSDKDGGLLYYDVYLDTLNPPSALAASGLATASYFADSLSYNTTYYWKVFASNDKGVITAGPVWSFTTLPHSNQAPYAPVYLAPADGAPWEYPTLLFNWTCTDPNGEDDNPLCYDIYLGTTASPPLFCPQYQKDWTLWSSLSYATTYYWKIVAWDIHGASTSGPIHSFTTRACPWYSKKDMPSKRYFFSTAVVNNKIYIIGGKDPSQNVLSLVEEYDPINDTWTQKADIPTPRSESAAAVYNNTVYIFGGYTNKVEVYDPLANIWTVKNDAPEDIASATAAVFQNKIYVSSSGIHVYDPAIDDWWDSTWVETYTDTLEDTTYYDTIYTWTNPHYPGSNPVILNNELYFLNVGGGFWRYNESLDTCLFLHGVTIPYSLSYYGTVIANNYLYVLGGYDAGSYSDRVSKYDPFTDTWYIRSDMQTGRSTIGTAYVNNCIYVFGGLNVLWLSSVEEYRLEEDPKNIPVR